MVIRMDALFLVDRDARKKQMTGEERLAARRQHAEVWAEEIRQECVKLAATVLPKSALGKAITYTLNQWPKLRRCFDYGEVELSNNLAENSMRPVTLGRNYAQGAILQIANLLCPGNIVVSGSNDACQRIAEAATTAGAATTTTVVRSLSPTRMLIVSLPGITLDDLLRPELQYLPRLVRSSSGAWVAVWRQAGDFTRYGQRLPVPLRHDPARPYGTVSDHEDRAAGGRDVGRSPDAPGPIPAYGRSTRRRRTP
jgi:hypothetical protein